jgi:hypothetical protein
VIPWRLRATSAPSTRPPKCKPRGPGFVSVSPNSTRTSHFGTLQDDGDEIPNPDDERLDSSITQLIVGYQVHPRFGFQVNLPLIARDFRRVTTKGAQKGDEDGVGDLSLTANVLAWSYVSENSVINLSLLGGLKFPSGDADRLAEEKEPHALDVLNDDFERGLGTRGGGAHDEARSGIHGHDLALGTGSFDPVVGGRLLATWHRFYWTTAVQYTIRTRGSFDYEYADELVVNAGPGFYALARHDYALGVGAALITETKGKDNIDGEILDDTGITSLYAGPALQFTWGTSLSVDLTADLPAIQNNTALQIVPDFRLRAGVVWRF